MLDDDSAGRPPRSPRDILGSAGFAVLFGILAVILAMAAGGL